MSLRQNWSSGMLDGYVTDYGVFDFDGDGQKEIFILSVSEAGILSNVKSRLTVFKQAVSRALKILSMTTGRTRDISAI